jgi:hypothetical protein
MKRTKRGKCKGKIGKDIKNNCPKKIIKELKEEIL